MKSKTLMNMLGRAWGRNKW